jgi:putative ABC transport system substrate-binding protein
VLRRDVIALIGAAAVAWPLAARAQPSGKVWRIGHLALSPRLPDNPIFGAFLAKLRDLGYVEGQNLIFEWRSADGHADRLPTLAAELVRLNVDLILTPNTQTTLAAKRATPTIPIVMCAASDPVDTGLVTSLARPGGNVTGGSVTGGELSRKRLELLKEVIPTIFRVAVLFDPTNASHPIFWRETEIAAKVLGVTLQRVDVRAPEDIEAAFAAIGQLQVDALFVFTEPMIYNERGRIADLAARDRLPVVNMIRGAAEAGDLMSYGPDYPDLYRRAAIYVDKILKGAKPADLPVEEPVKFDLVINLKTAKALGITIPQSVLLRADEVIE